MTKPKSFVCFNASYMNYGYISSRAICAQPPIACDKEIWELIKLKTGKQVQIFYCTYYPTTNTKQTEDGTKQKGLYIKLWDEETKTGPACSISGRK